MKPILDDVRVFSDKIARDPRQLGLKGALDRRPSAPAPTSAALFQRRPRRPIIIDGTAISRYLSIRTYNNLEP